MKHLLVLSLMLYLTQAFHANASGIFMDYAQKDTYNNLTYSTPYLLANETITLKNEIDESPAHKVGGYSKEIEIFNQFKNKLSKTEFEKFNEWYLSQIYFSFQKTAVDNGNSKDNVFHGIIRYNKDNQFPIDGIIAAKNYLLSIPSFDLTVSHIQNVHKLTLSGESVKKNHSPQGENCQGFKDGELGKIRNQDILFKIRTADTSKKIKDEDIETDCYDKKLPFHDYQTTRSPKTYGDLTENNPFVTIDGGTADYLRLGNWKNFEHRLKPTTISLIKKVEKCFKRKGIDIDYSRNFTTLDLIYNVDKNCPFAKYLFRKFIYDNLEYTIEEVKFLLSQAKTKDDVIYVAAKFYRDFLSIHPFADGNGRTARLLTAKILNDYDIATPIMVFPHDDVTFDYYDLYHVFRDSIKFSDNFHENLLYTAQNNLFFGLATPVLTTALYDEKFGIPNENFFTWLAYQPESEETLFDHFENYKEWIKSVYKPEENLVSKLATPTYYRMFKRNSSSLKSFEFKREHSYLKKEMIFTKFPESKYKTSSLINTFLGKTNELDSSSQSHTKEGLASIFTEFNTLVSKQIDINEGHFSMIDALILENFDAPKRPCLNDSESFIEYHSLKPLHGYVKVNNDIALAGGIDFEALEKIRYCRNSHHKNYLTVVKRLNFFTLKVQKYENGKLKDSKIVNINEKFKKSQN